MTPGEMADRLEVRAENVVKACARLGSVTQAQVDESVAEKLAAAAMLRELAAEKAIWQPMLEQLVRALTHIADHYGDGKGHCAICFLTAEVALAGDWPYNTHAATP